MQKMFSNRSGSIYHAQSDYDCYIPKSLSEIELVLAMNYIFSHPYFDSTDLRKFLNVTKPTVLNIISIFCKLNIISPVAEKQRYVTYRFNEYITILEVGTEI